MADMYKTIEFADKMVGNLTIQTANIQVENIKNISERNFFINNIKSKKPDKPFKIPLEFIYIEIDIE